MLQNSICCLCQLMICICYVIQVLLLISSVRSLPALNWAAVVLVSLSPLFSFSYIHMHVVGLVPITGLTKLLIANLTYCCWLLMSRFFFRVNPFSNIAPLARHTSLVSLTSTVHTDSTARWVTLLPSYSPTSPSYSRLVWFHTQSMSIRYPWYHTIHLLTTTP